ncbi:hypothetical protein E2C01_048040 [Portunus trituberculatus]|uniref:Uncharacterized protein n=1 Tax=Portunus trituberculatus TaxID=210409 RepID=A0A5B7GA51_PORTR|nr:hypothetical protein [Portunus trituberculatus]
MHKDCGPGNGVKGTGVLRPGSHNQCAGITTPFPIGRTCSTNSPIIVWRLGERFRSDVLVEIATLIRWKKLTATGVKAAPPEFMVNTIREAVPLGAMGMVPGSTPIMHIPSATTVFRPQQQVVQQTQVVHRPPIASTPFEANTRTLQSLGIPGSFVVDNLPSFTVNIPIPDSAPPTSVHTTSNTLTTPKM